MSLLILLVLLGVVAAIAVVAAGRGSSLPDPEPDISPYAALPDGSVDRHAVAALRFPVVFRGYRMTAVDAALERLVAELESRDQRIAALEGQSPPGDVAARPAGEA